MILLSALWLIACEETEKTPEVEGEFLLDQDADGFIGAEDCDDNTDYVQPR